MIILLSPIFSKTISKSILWSTSLKVYLKSRTFWNRLLLEIGSNQTCVSVKTNWTTMFLIWFVNYIAWLIFENNLSSKLKLFFSVRAINSFIFVVIHPSKWMGQKIRLQVQERNAWYHFLPLFSFKFINFL